jgi:DNA-binding NarL/FixJ family response regulator
MGRTVLIVDDHPSFRASARRMLEADGFEVVGEAQDGETAVMAAAQLRPELVLLDVRLSDIDGLEVAQRMLRGPGWRPQVVLVSSHDSSDLGDAIDASGALGFIPKSELSTEAIDSLVS